MNYFYETKWIFIGKIIIGWLHNGKCPNDICHIMCNLENPRHWIDRTISIDEWTMELIIECVCTVSWKEQRHVLVLKNEKNCVALAELIRTIGRLKMQCWIEACITQSKHIRIECAVKCDPSYFIKMLKWTWIRIDT